jgi:hypothetical protein
VEKHRPQCGPTQMWPNLILVFLRKSSRPMVWLVTQILKNAQTAKINPNWSPWSRQKIPDKKATGVETKLLNV